MGKQFEVELKVGLFVTIGLGLIMFAILLLGGANSLFTRNNFYYTHFPSVEGLINGAKVVIGGLQVGTVDDVSFDAEKKDIKVRLQVARKYGEWVRKDSSAEILTQGVLGDKYISIASGTQEQPILATESEIPNKPTKDLSQFLTKGDALMGSLNSIAASLERVLKSFEAKNRSEIFFDSMSAAAKNLASASQKLNVELDQLKLKAAIGNLNGVLEKVNNGTGTIGALINDPGLYYDAKALLGGANRNRIIRNLVRKTVKDGEAEPAETEKKANQ